MRKKFMAALMAAVSVMPSLATAQDRGDRGDRRAARVERMQQRQSQDQAAVQGQVQVQRAQVQAQGGMNVERRQQREAARAAQAQSGGWQQRQPQQVQQQAPQSGWQQRQRREAPAGGWQQARPDRAQQPGGWNRAQVAQPRLPAERRDDRADYRNNRGNDRQPFVNGGQRADQQRNWNRNGADWNDQRRWNNGNQYRNDQRGWNNGRDDRGGWNRDWRRDSRYDWNRWRSSNRNAFHLPRYYAPYGWNSGYRSFGVGAVLSSLLFAQDYWIADPWSYRLPQVDGSYRWVRYYNDALLVDVYSGEVVDVVNGIFW
jgi:hypothetical protein